MKSKAAWIAWAFCGLVGLAAIRNVIYEITNPKAGADFFGLVTEAVIAGLIPVVYAAVGALIISRQPRNLVGWLLLGPALLGTLGSLLPDYQSWAAAPTDITFGLLIGLWYSGWNWLLLIFPVLLIMLVFPTGRPPSRRWNWVGYLALGMTSFFILLTTFSRTLTLEGLSWEVPNPIGFIPASFSLAPFFMPIWGLCLFTLVIACVASLVVRYRRAGPVEREQIKWLLYACGLFGALYILAAAPIIFSGVSSSQGLLLAFLALTTIPIAIAIAILRYRLWDIEVLIRRTMVYGVLTVTLGLVFFGGVTLLQSLFTAISGEKSAISIVLSTLTIAALFNPLRRRIQSSIDRRFYRRKYDAQKLLEGFAQTARNQTDAEQLSADLVSVVQETLQPESVTLWLKPVREKT